MSQYGIVVKMLAWDQGTKKLLRVKIDPAESSSSSWIIIIIISTEFSTLLLFVFCVVLSIQKQIIVHKSFCYTFLYSTIQMLAIYKIKTVQK